MCRFLMLISFVSVQTSVSSWTPKWNLCGWCIRTNMITRALSSKMETVRTQSCAPPPQFCTFTNEWWEKKTDRYVIFFRSAAGYAYPTGDSANGCFVENRRSWPQVCIVNCVMPRWSISRKMCAVNKHLKICVYRFYRLYIDKNSHTHPYIYIYI